MHTHSTAVEFFPSFKALESGEPHSALGAALLVNMPQVAVCLQQVDKNLFSNVFVLCKIDRKL